MSRPREYYQEDVAQFFCDITQTGHSPYPLPTPIYKVLAKIVETVMFRPFITPDIVERLKISDQPTEGTMRLQDFGIFNPKSMESSILPVVRAYGGPNSHPLPLEFYGKKFSDYSIKPKNVVSIKY